MIHLPGGIFAMGSERFYPEEAPVRKVRVDPFRIDETPVTNARFAEFVAATGHVTFAEIPPDPKDYPGMLPELAQAGSLVFEMTPGPVDLDQVQWWEFRIGANWRQPLGPGSSIEGLKRSRDIDQVFSKAIDRSCADGKACQMRTMPGSRGPGRACQFGRPDQ